MNTLLPSNKKFGSSGFTIGRLMGGVAVVCSLLVFGESWYTLFVFEVVAIYICSDILVGYLPASLAAAMKRNCIRLDGNWSTKREDIEKRAIRKLRWDIRLIFLLVFLPTTLLAWVFDREVFPLTVGLSALASLRASDEQSKENLADEEEKFDKWAKKTSLGIDAKLHKQIAWYFWPVAVLGVVLWFAGCWLTIRNMFLYQLRELAEQIKLRQAEYAHCDRHRFF